MGFSLDGISGCVDDEAAAPASAFAFIAPGTAPAEAAEFEAGSGSAFGFMNAGGVDDAAAAAAAVAAVV